MPRLASLGGLALLGDDGPLTGPAARGRNLALLVLLARAGQAGMTREKLAAYLWPESDTEHARHSLDQALYTLRRALGVDSIFVASTTIALDPGVVQSDLADFTGALESAALKEAVAFYGGPFLDGFHLSGAADFERWVDAERAELHGRFVKALEELARATLAAGDVLMAIGYWRRLAAAEPLSSRAALGLMRALAQGGDPAGALRAASVHEALLREELGAPPDPSIAAYAEELRRQPAPTTTSTAVTASGTVSASTPVTATATAAGSRRRRLPIAIAAGTIIVVVAITILAARTAPASEQPLMVAVTAFENETGDAALEPFGRMAADWITEGLVRTGLVRVVDASTPRAAPDERESAKAATGPSRVESIVSGRVYRAGDSIWIQARITEARSGVILRALDAVGIAEENPSPALEPLRQQILGALGTLYDRRIATWARSALRPPSFAAYLEFVAGLELHAVPRDLAGAAVRFRRAAQLDSTFLLAPLWLAWASQLDGDWIRADSVIVALRRHRDRMSPLERAWHGRIAALLTGDNEASYRAAKEMVRLAPGSGWALALANAALDTNRPRATVDALRHVGIENLGLEREHGWFLLTGAWHLLGDFRRELAATDQAIDDVGLNWGFVGPGVPALAALGRLDALEKRLEELRNLPRPDFGLPLWPQALLTAAVELRAHGFPDAVAPLVDRMLERGASRLVTSSATEPAGWVQLQLLYELGRWDDAQRLIREAPLTHDSALQLRAMSGLLAARRADTVGAREVAAELAAIDRPYLFGEPTFWRARIEAILGNQSDALALLRQALAEGHGAPAWYWLHAGRDFEGLRQEREFQELVRPN